ncbi:hypothetical protein Godav_008633 [Gossypium davidsonii]|uniref:GDSL esterase/lipase 1-like n=2 Tax=Gossypium TaxID=3633 RepID=A0A7J8SBD4_GOSDV|nr:hypothetical protein [Gossypium davidsonii]MBA0658693.1 hypothetical protein [Gossypium klotzschianum]
MARLVLLWCFFIFTATSVNLVCSRSPQKDHTALFVFGDSLYDPGNNNYIDTIIKANYYPYGETFFKYPTGRFSDGRIIADFIAEFANLPLIPPYLQPGNHEFTYGVNFASAGAGALSETYQGFVIDLKTQLSYFKKVAKLMRKELGDAEATVIFSKAVYLINIGGNDYISFLTSNSTVFQSSSKQEYVAMVMGNLTETIEEIYKKGGRKFGFLNMGSLGCVPSMKALAPGNTTGSCFEQVNEIAKLHDAALPKALEELETKLVQVKYSMHYLNISYGERRNNPQKYGFKEANIACCGSGPYRGMFSCGGRGVTKYELCSDPNDYLFFDSDHLTEKACKQIAQLMWSGTPNITGPYNLKALFEV